MLVWMIDSSRINCDGEYKKWKAMITSSLSSIVQSMNQCDEDFKNMYETFKKQQGNWAYANVEINKNTLEDVEEKEDCSESTYYEHLKGTTDGRSKVKVGCNSFAAQNHHGITLLQVINPGINIYLYM